MYKARESVFYVHENKKEECSKMKGKKQKKKEEKRMKSKLQKTGDKRNNFNSTCGNNSNISYISNNKFKFVI